MELMEVPKCVSRNTGEQVAIVETIDNFFTNTKEYIEEVLFNTMREDFEIKNPELTYNRIESNDGLAYLLYKEKYIIAGVIETRTAFNNLHYTFFRDLSFLEKLLHSK